MNTQDARGIVTLCLMAAFADGQKHAREREEVRRIADSLAEAGELHLPTLSQEVLMKRSTLAGVASQIQDAQARQLAYEMALAVCDADGSLSEAERAFLAELESVLGLTPGEARAFTQQAEALTSAPLAAGTALVTPPTAPTAAAAMVDGKALDRQILNAAILNGALELLPETLSTMAIIPLQMKLVYGIGRAHGYELDTGHVKDFLATVGVGLTSQYLEQAGRKLLGGLLGKVGGSLLGGMGKQAVSSGMSFATTYALGHAARRYYGSGRQLSTQMLKDAFAGVVQEGQELRARYLPDMQAKARTLDAGQVLAMVRGH